MLEALVVVYSAVLVAAGGACYALGRRKGFSEGWNKGWSDRIGSSKQRPQ